MKKYELIDGRKVDLGQLNAREKRFLHDLQRMAEKDVSYFEIYRAAVGPGSPALGGRNRVDRRIVESAFYLAARDIATRAGIRQGLVLAPEHEAERAKVPADASMMSVAQAAELIGITRAAVYKAIDKGALHAIRVGNVTVVDRRSAVAYRDRRSSQMAPNLPAPRSEERGSPAHAHALSARPR